MSQTTLPQTLSNKIYLKPYETGTYHGKFCKAEVDYDKNNVCRLKFVMYLSIKGMSDYLKLANGDWLNYSASVIKYYKESKDPIAQVAQQKEIIEVVSTILGLNTERINDALLPPIPFDNCCDFYNHVAQYVNRVATELVRNTDTKTKIVFALKLENWKDVAWPKLGCDWITSADWRNVRRYHHEDLIHNKTAFRISTYHHPEGTVFPTPVKEEDIEPAPAASGPAPAPPATTGSKKDNKVDVKPNVDLNDPFGQNVNYDDLPF